MHWHGAAAKTTMSHIAVEQAVNVSPVIWMEKASNKRHPVGAAAG